MSTVLNAMAKGGARTWNNAVSNSTSGSLVLDYFAKCGSYRGRTQSEVNSSLASIFGEDKELATKVLFYNRLVTRKCKGFVEETESVQKGQGQKDEFIKSLIWLESNYPSVLYKNLWLVPEIGCWKDLWYDSPVTKLNHYVDTDEVYKLVEQGMQDEYHRHLLAKFLPKIRSAKNVKTDRHRRLNRWAKGLCKYLGWTERDYRKFKSNPKNTAHKFQRVMCENNWNKLNFNEIPGRALFGLTSQKGKDGKNAVERHGLTDKYLKWIEKQPTAKFKGYPYELLLQAKKNRSLMQKHTYDKQFEGLLNLAREGNSEVLKKGVLCALDTSGSMGHLVHYGYGGNQPQPIDICVGLGIYFSALLEGHFKDNVIMFDDNSKLKKLSGGFCDRVDQIKNSATAWGSTNFQSVIDELVRVRKQNPNIPVEDFPEVLLVVSDMQFNPSRGYSWTAVSQSSVDTNYEVAMRKLQSVGLPKMTIIWWQVNGRFTGDVPSTMFDEGTVLISGFDGTIVTSLLGNDTVVDEKTGQKRKANPYEQMLGALDQEILNAVQI